jgi:hypothetical protein
VMQRVRFELDRQPAILSELARMAGSVSQKIPYAPPERRIFCPGWRT